MFSTPEVESNGYLLFSKYIKFCHPILQLNIHHTDLESNFEDTCMATSRGNIVLEGTHSLFAVVFFRPHPPIQLAQRP
jgi:hypothetical protein